MLFCPRVILRCGYQRAIANYRYFASEIVESETEKDPAFLFFNNKVQKGLMTLTRVDYTKIFRKRMDGHQLLAPKYAFMTDKDLEKAMNKTKHLATKYLQMPPVVKVRIDRKTILSNDPALRGFSTSSYVFTDISYNLKSRERLIVVREVDGTLRDATWEERDRLNQVYVPIKGREMIKPKMFQQEYLMDLINREEYEFVLDRACVQFEPDDPEYHRVTKTVYEALRDKKNYDILRSTRHFGPFVFHLLWNNDIDDLLCDLIKSERIDEAATLVSLFHEFYPEAKSAVEECQDPPGDFSLVNHYVQLDSQKKDLLVARLNTYLQMMEMKAQIAKGIKVAHGIHQH